MEVDLELGNLYVYREYRVFVLQKLPAEPFWFLNSQRTMYDTRGDGLKLKTQKENRQIIEGTTSGTNMWEVPIW